MKKLLLLLLLPIFSFAQNCVPTTIVINLDQYQSETYWTIEDTSGNMLTYGTNYGSQPDYASVVEQRCLPPGPLNFTIYDTYGDGLNGAMWGGLDGSYYVVQCYDTIVSGTNAAFGSDTAHAILVAPCPPIFGCMDSSYVEFNPRADTSDGSCSELVVFGCTDSTMYNYDSIANTMSLVPSCDYILTLTDLVGDGWAASNLEVTQGDSVWNFTLDTTAYSQEYIINLKAPQEVSFKFSISQQAFQSAAHCGFKLENPLGMTMIEVIPPFIQPLLKRTIPTYCGNYCIDKVFGCMDPLALNYVDTANTSTQCFYVLGCTNSSYLEYYTQGFVADTSDGSCEVKAEWGCTDSTAFNYDTIANIDNGGCVAVIYGCMQPLAFNYNANANTDDGGCVPFIYGCTDPTMFNFDQLANTDDNSCLPYVFGCTDSIMFNYNPLANADNNSCIPFIYGCTDPSMLNYNTTANTEDFSCISYIYGCTDSTALNYNPTANTDNNSCISMVQGCMDQTAYNFNPTANTPDSLSCNYDANCITGPGNPYWLNDPCYAWVINVDEYCCENEWDNICQLTYNYCEGTWTELIPKRITEKKLLMITDLLGRPVNKIKNELLLYIYDDGSVERKIIINK
tara:strand:- start:1172 stop:3040 length:1869 start_codon:yes stop_codon:yes gene_type:complete